MLNITLVVYTSSITLNSDFKKDTKSEGLIKKVSGWYSDNDFGEYYYNGGKLLQQNDQLYGRPDSRTRNSIRNKIISRNNTKTVEPVQKNNESDQNLSPTEHPTENTPKTIDESSLKDMEEKIRQKVLKEVGDYKRNCNKAQTVNKMTRSEEEFEYNKEAVKDNTYLRIVRLFFDNFTPRSYQKEPEDVTY